MVTPTNEDCAELRDDHLDDVEFDGDNVGATTTSTVYSTQG